MVICLERGADSDCLDMVQDSSATAIKIQSHCHLSGTGLYSCPGKEVLLVVVRNL